ncbi:MAG: Gfo/Idh/MocA family oxidoreductase [Armatimonadetes bacterium]|nr:Gfo/Idh/MocA family oxidoreductase [Armatimonadota bacterium]
MEQVRVGLIGAGMIGLAHAKALAEVPEAELRVVADLREPAAQEVASAANVAQVETDWQKVVADPSLDAVVVATPPFLHYEMAMAAIAAGKHVLCEKPFAHSPAAADAMVAAADRQGVVIADCSARHARLNPTYRTVKALIDQGKLGEIYLINHFGRGRRGRAGIEYHPAAKWFLDRSKAVGGIGIDWGVYDLSLIFGLLGDEVECVEAMGFAVRGIDQVDPGTPIFDVEEHGGGALRFSNGAMVLWDRASACHMDTGSVTRVCGKRGGVRFEPWSRQAQSLTYYSDVVDGLPTDVEVPIKGQDKHGGDHPHIDRDFVAALLAGREPMMPGRVAAKVLRAIFMIYASAGVAELDEAVPA